MKKAPKLTARQTYILQIILGVLVVSLVAGLVWSVWYVTRLPGQTISQVVVEPGPTVSTVVVKEIVEETLEGTYAALIPRRFKHLYPQHQIVKEVETIPRIEQAVVERDGTELHVSFEEYLPYALWCKEALDYCLLVDEVGYAFEEAPPMVGGSMVRFVNEEAIVALGQTLAKQSALDSILEFTGLLKLNFGFRTRVVTLKSSGDIYYTLQGGAVLRTGFEHTNQETLKNLSTILESEEFKHLEPDNFQYIDLRFGNKVYVNEELFIDEVASTTTATSSLELVEVEELE